MSEVLHFLLVPDSTAARRVRRAIASRDACAGVVVGSRKTLVDEARKAYLVPKPDPGWGTRLAQAAAEIENPFWHASYIADSKGTVDVLGEELERLLVALGPGKPIAPDSSAARFSERGRRHLADLSRLHEAMGRELPPELAAVDALLAADGADATRLIAVHRRNGLPDLSPWDEALLEKLAADCGARPHPDLDAIFDAETADVPRGTAGSALRHLQEHLFVADAPRAALDPSVTCLGVRDLLEEAEVAAGMAQEALRRDPSLGPSDIGILVPGILRYEEAVREAFALAGIPVSGLSGPPPVRNVGGETVFHFLATRRRPAPAMALAALYSSPLMPWDREAGACLAAAIMKRDFAPKPPEGASPDAERMMALIREHHETPRRVRDALAEFGSLLAGSGAMERHAKEARSSLSSLAGALADAGDKEIDWEELAALVPQAPLASDVPAEFTREGAALLREGEEPWRPVRLLFVLGFSEGRYPAGPRRSAVFDDRDLAVLAGDLGFAVATAQEAMARGRARFARQLGCASDRAVFLSPLRNPEGEPFALCGTAAFMARLFTDVETADDLVLTLEREAHRSRAAGLPLAASRAPVFPRTLEIRDPCLGPDLLLDEEGGARHETPSRLEELLVSPLAWFLDRHDLLPREWAPEELDPAAKGILAHAVFERLFSPDAPLPGAAGIRSSVSKLLDEAVLAHAPFLLSAEWYVERRNLLREIEQAALRFGELLAGAKAAVLGVETTLAGSVDGIPIRGRTDLLLGLPSGRIFIVDYKKSRSDRRRTCMERGYDIQTSLYRHMLAGGSVVGPGASALGRLLKEGAEIGILYYMMDDQRVLTDRREWLPGNLPAVESPGDGISENAEALLSERFGALRAGVLPLNAADDEERFRKVGVPTYALSRSPLVARFVHPPRAAEEEP